MMTENLVEAVPPHQRVRTQFAKRAPTARKSSAVASSDWLAALNIQINR